MTEALLPAYSQSIEKNSQYPLLNRRDPKRLHSSRVFIAEIFNVPIRCVSPHQVRDIRSHGLE